MLQNIDIEGIKQYNSSLKTYRDKASQLKAEAEYTNKMITDSCAELSQELGVQVTRENIEQIYQEQLEKINSTLQSGNAVLQKIANEGSNAAQATPQPQVAQSLTMQQPQAPVPPQPMVQPVAQPEVQMAQPVAPQAPVQQVVTEAPVFTTPQAGDGTLPPFFGTSL